MRILLAYTNIGTRNGPHYPHGLGALAAALTHAGHEVQVHLLDKMRTEVEWKCALDRAEPELLACSFGSHQWPHAKAIMAWSREHGLPVLAGGVHATFAAAEVLGSGACDWVCVGEGEGALLDLAAGNDPRGIANLAGEGFANPPRPLIADLNDLPIYDRSHFPMGEILWVNAHEITMLVGRGCPYPCTYCCNGAWRELYCGQRWVRHRSVSHLFDEMEALLDNYYIQSFYFEDDIFTLDREFLELFLDQYPRSFPFPFRAYLRIGTVTRDDLRRLHQAGLRMANVGIEHGDERMRREVLGRSMSDAAIAEFFDWCRELGIRTRAFHIVGAPGETPQTHAATRSLCRQVAPDEVQVSLFEPYPGTTLYEQCVADGSYTGVTRDTYFEAQVAVRLKDYPEDALLRDYEAFCEERTEIESCAFDLAVRAQRKGDIDLIEQFTDACVIRHGAEPVVRKRVCIGLDERFCLFAHPRSEIRFAIPAGRYRLQMAMAFDPLCEQWSEAPARFVVRRGEGIIFEQVLDPKSEDTEDWMDWQVSFEADEPTMLTFETSPDHGDDLTGLWTLWGHPHLVREGGA